MIYGPYQVKLLPPKPDISNESLDLGGLVHSLFTLTLGDGSPHDKLPDIDVWASTIKFPNLLSSLGAESPGKLNISQSWDVLLSLLHDDKVNDDDIWADDATTDSLSFKLTLPARAEARVDLAEKKTGSALNDDTLHHGEALLIVATSNFKDVPLEFITKDASVHLCAHALVEERCA